jgi:hypothetical protein
LKATDNSKFDILIVYDNLNNCLIKAPVCEIINGDIKELLPNNNLLLEHNGSKQELESKQLISCIQDVFPSMKIDHIQLILKELGITVDWKK